MNIAAADFNIESLDLILKDLRNSRRAVVAIESGREETKAKVEQAQGDLQAALKAVDLDGITKHSDELKRGLRKLAESPTEKVEAFDTAVDRFVDFVNLNEDSLASVPVTELKEAA